MVLAFYKKKLINDIVPSDIETLYKLLIALQIIFLAATTL